MDMWQDIKLATIPRPLKAVFALGALLVLALNLYILYAGFRRGNYDMWIAAGGYLLGVVLPGILIMLLVVFSHSGVRALRDRTRQLLTGLIPEQLAFTADQAALVRRRFGRRLRLARKRAEIETKHLPGECWADYVLKVPAVDARRTVLRLRVEVNVRCVNIDLFVPESATDAALRKSGREPAASDEAARLEVLRSLFEHTLSGAQGAGYRINQRVVKRNAGGKMFDCIVLARDLSRDFLWDAAEKLWFAQDLMFMIRSFAQERPEVFNA